MLTRLIRNGTRMYTEKKQLSTKRTKNSQNQMHARIFYVTRQVGLYTHAIERFVS